MADSKIEWTEQTWNPIVGCSVVSPGCTNCYAMKMAARLDAMGQPRYAGLTKPSKAGAVWTGEMRLLDEALTIPLRRRKPTTFLVNSMSDLFHESVPDEWIDRVFAVMALCPQHTFQVLTKRSARMRAYVERLSRTWILRLSAAINTSPEMIRAADRPDRDTPTWPLPNVWLGVSAEDQRRAEERVPDLLATPAAVRFVSAEPLLGPIDFHDWFIRAVNGFAPALDWIRVGGEIGPNARPMHPAWARSIRDQCSAAGVAFHFKQWGGWAPGCNFPDGIPSATSYDFGDQLLGDLHSVWRVGKKAAGRLLDGVEHNGMPKRLLPSDPRPCPLSLAGEA